MGRREKENSSEHHNGGPAPERLKIDDGWKEALRRALRSEEADEEACAAPDEQDEHERED